MRKREHGNKKWETGSTVEVENNTDQYRLKKIAFDDLNKDNYTEYLGVEMGMLASRNLLYLIWITKK